jgi:23S rRNA (uracil1939-C5)-methyltransferase
VQQVAPSERLALDHAPRRGERLRVSVSELDSDGVGVAVVPVALGPDRHARTFYVEVAGAVPGDELVVEVLKYRKNHVSARPLDWVERSRLRVDPRCPHFGPREAHTPGCGGCRLSFYDYPEQLRWKADFARRAVEAEGLRELVWRDPLVAPAPWYYRNKMELSFGRDDTGRLALGMHPRGYRHEVLALAECFLQTPLLAPLSRAVAEWAAALGLEPYDGRTEAGFLRTLTVREGVRTGQRLVELTTDDAEEVVTTSGPRPVDDVVRSFEELVISWFHARSEALSSLYWTRHRARRGERTRLIETLRWGAPHLEEQLVLGDDHRLRFQIHPRAFFQTNTHQAEALYREVIAAASPQIAKPRRVLDLYCGTGTIGLALARGAERVVGVELQPDAVQNARANAALNGVENVEYHCGDVGEVLPGVTGADPWDAVVVDPPRAGLGPKARALVASLDAARLVYVSCNPLTLARDLRALRDADWRIAWIRAVDMFPQTTHVECVALLERGQA